MESNLPISSKAFFNGWVELWIYQVGFCILYTMIIPFIILSLRLPGRSSRRLAACGGGGNPDSETWPRSMVPSDDQKTADLWHVVWNLWCYSIFFKKLQSFGLKLKFNKNFKPCSFAGAQWLDEYNDDRRICLDCKPHVGHYPWIKLPKFGAGHRRWTVRFIKKASFC